LLSVKNNLRDLFVAFPRFFRYGGDIPIVVDGHFPFAWGANFSANQKSGCHVQLLDGGKLWDLGKTRFTKKSKVVSFLLRTKRIGWKEKTIQKVGLELWGDRMNGAKFDCSRKSREAHENNSVPIRVSAEAFQKFRDSMAAYWDHVVSLYGSPRRFRFERRSNPKPHKLPKASR